MDGNPTTKPLQGILLTLLTLWLATTTFTFAQTIRPSSASRVKRTVMISIPDRKLAVLEEGNVIAKFPISVGAAASPSPAGKFQVISRVSNPTYYRPGTVIPSGKENPLGTRWLGLSQKGYGIHGTNAPKSVGHAASHGCIRLRNLDMERLFAMLRVGDAVEILAERNQEMARTFGGEWEAAAATESDQPAGQ